MSTVNTTFVTISCDSEGCANTATFPGNEEGEKQAFADNQWMNSLRFVNTVDQRKYVYCSDTCEAKALATGVHNKRVIVPAAGPNDAALAAQAAHRAAVATEALKSGKGKVVLE